MVQIRSVGSAARPYLLILVEVLDEDLVDRLGEEDDLNVLGQQALDQRRRADLLYMPREARGGGSGIGVTWNEI